MLTINTIQDFMALPMMQQEEILRGIRAKDRLDQFLLKQNGAQPVAPPHWVKCSRCHPDYPGWHWKEQHLRDNSDIHPSQIDKCLKYLVLCCSGYAEQHEEVVDARMRMIFDMGHAWHHTLQSYGMRGAWCDPEDYKTEAPMDPEGLAFDGTPALPIAAEYWIKGHADAVLEKYLLSTPTLGDVSIRLIHEYKSIKSSGYEKLNRPKPEHKKQATIYSAVFNVPVVVYLYANKDTCNIADFPVPFDYTIWNEVVQKVKAVQYYVNNDQPVPWEHTAAVLSPSECNYCGLKKVCQPPSALRRIG